MIVVRRRNQEEVCLGAAEYGACGPASSLITLDGASPGLGAPSEEQIE
jgi:hypothetical protein